MIVKTAEVVLIATGSLKEPKSAGVYSYILIKTAKTVLTITRITLAQPQVLFFVSSSDSHMFMNMD